MTDAANKYDDTQVDVDIAAEQYLAAISERWAPSPGGLKAEATILLREFSDLADEYDFTTGTADGFETLAVAMAPPGTVGIPGPEVTFRATDEGVSVEAPGGKPKNLTLYFNPRTRAFVGPKRHGVHRSALEVLARAVYLHMRDSECSRVPPEFFIPNRPPEADED